MGNPQGQGAIVQPAGTGQGIVQTVAGRAVVLRELDGSTVTVPVNSSTKVFVDGVRASLANVTPGFVASASWKAGEAAGRLQAFDPSATVAVVESVSARALMVRNAAGETVTVRVTPTTRVLVDGKPATLARVAVGDTLVMNAAGQGRKTATELRFLQPG